MRDPMTFGYSKDGKLVPVEQLALVNAIADLDSKLNTLEPATVRTGAEKLRKLLMESGDVVTAQDEEVFVLWSDGVIDFRNVEDHFGQRLQRAVASKYQSGTSEA